LYATSFNVTKNYPVAWDARCRVFQMVKVHQSTVDAYLEDIVSSAIDHTANAQARREVQQMAVVINDAAYEAEQRSLYCQ